jgi:predicted nucleic acid-binding protein
MDEDVRRPVPIGTDRPREQGQPRARGRARRPVLYVDASALVKLAKVEDHSTEARDFIAAAQSDQQRSGYHGGLSGTPPDRGHRFEIRFGTSFRRAAFFLGLMRLHPISRATLRHAADFFEPKLHSLDAIHVISALEVRPIDFFVTYDKRQARAARRSGPPTVSPGA